ncbi:MAG: DUF86 domain-containing protein [candidate division KSB1 bacterium]|nr:DUF86 domain-containing protein [candidate division KSB1 bacterium]MDZ7399583.1 DUF86 domain-containing protein [candidate division KSB1 bacterium]
MVKTDVLYRKISQVKHHLERLKAKQKLSRESFLTDLDAQDSVLLNLQHAIQGIIDIGAHIISDEAWGVPGSLSDIFYKLEDHGLISPSLVEKLIPMIGFRNLIVHQYGDINFSIVYEIYQKRLEDIENFLDVIQSHFQP